MPYVEKAQVSDRPRIQGSNRSMKAIRADLKRCVIIEATSMLCLPSWCLQGCAWSIPMSFQPQVFPSVTF